MAGVIFRQPGWLWLLLLAAGLAAGYLLAQRRKSRYTVKFTNTELLRAVMPRRPRWRRHLPPALMVLAAIGMSLGLADPAVRITEPAPGRMVVLAVDDSPSMMATDVAPSRFDAMRAAVRSFVDHAPGEVLVGLVSFAGTARVEVAPTADHAQVTTALDRLGHRSNTSLAQAVLTALNAVQTAEATTGPLPATVVLLSDGGSNVNPPLSTGVDAARDEHVTVSTIALGTPAGEVTLAGGQRPVPVDTKELATLAQQTGGRSFDAASVDDLRATYADIGGSLTGPARLRGIAAWFFLVSLLLLVAAGSLSLLWFSGLP